MGLGVTSLGRERDGYGINCDGYGIGKKVGRA